MIISLFRDRVTLVWLLLVVGTVVSWRLGADHGVGPHGGASAVILVVAFIKVRLVGLYFMEVRSAPAAVRVPFDAYCLVTCALLVGLLLLHG